MEAVKECPSPKSKEGVRSFLGMIGYMSKFIPRYSALTAPLRAITHKDAKFKWTREEKDAFEKLKSSITSEKTIAFFDPTDQSLFEQKPVSMKVYHLVCSKKHEREYSPYTLLAAL